MHAEREPLTRWVRILAGLAGCVAWAAATTQAGTWEPAPALPTGGQPREYAAGLNVAGTVYALGGTPWMNGGDMDGSVHALSAETGMWMSLPPLGGMGPIIRQGAGVDALGRILVFGGLNLDNGDPGEGKVYDPSEGPTTGIADRAPSAPLTHFAWCTDNAGYIYSLGGGPGAAATPSNPNRGYCERYDALADAWQPLAPMPTPVAGAAAVYDGAGRILVFGGIDALATARTTNVAMYDIATDTWSDSAVADMPAAISDHSAVLGADGRVYVLGGLAGELPGGTAQHATYVLDRGANTWSAGPSMLQARYHFAAALGGDDFVYAIGGRTDSGGTDQVERLYTPPCPTFVVPPPPTDAWVGQTVVLAATVSGGTPMDLVWRKDGVELADGPAPGGGTIGGATTATLRLTSLVPSDAGEYTLVASNACGMRESPAATLTVLVPPAIPQDWNVTNLHPAWALRSEARDVEGDTQVGVAGKDVGEYLNLDQPVLWHSSAASAQNLTPGGSVGGAVLAIGGGRLVGWWWWPYSCQVGGQWYTCYTRQASEWSGTPLAHFNRQVSGFEYSLINDTDGVTHVGSATWDDESGNYYTRAIVWREPGYYGTSIHPAGVSNSYLEAVDGGWQFGLIHTPFPGPQPHAALWAGAADTFADLHPGAYGTSAIAGAGDGQAVGTTGLNVDARATLWSYEPDTAADLNPPGASASGLRRCVGGLQVGWARFAEATHAGLWAGTPESFFDLHAFVGPEFLSTTAHGIDISPDGTIAIVGSGYNTTTGRQEALLWRSLPAGCPGDYDCDADIDFFDIDLLLAALGGESEWAAKYQQKFGTLPPCEYAANCDADGSGGVDFFDIDAFLDLLGTDCP